VVGYGFLATVLFYEYIVDFRTFVSSIQALLAIMLGYPVYEEMQQVAYVLFYACHQYLFHT